MLFFVINFHVVLQHFYLLLVDIIDNVFLELTRTMNRDSTNSTKWFKYFFNLIAFKSFT